MLNLLGHLFYKNDILIAEDFLESSLCVLEQKEFHREIVGIKLFAKSNLTQ